MKHILDEGKGIVDQFWLKKFLVTALNPLNPKSDQHLISPHRKAAELFIKIMRIGK